MSLPPELLAQLRAAGLAVTPHTYYAGEWFAGTIGPDGLGGGDVGPHDSPQAALVGGVAWLVRLLRENIERADAAEEEARHLRAALAAAQAELHAERAAKGQ